MAFADSNSRIIISLCFSDRGVNHVGNLFGEKTNPSEYPVETLASTFAEESGLESMLKPQESLAIFRICVVINQIASKILVWQCSRNDDSIGSEDLQGSSLPIAALDICAFQLQTHT
jgi:hypothetical protein